MKKDGSGRDVGRGNDDRRAYECALSIMGPSDGCDDKDWYNSTFQRIIDYVYDALVEDRGTRKIADPAGGGS